MEAVDALNDATPPLTEDQAAQDTDVIVLDDSDVQIVDPIATEAARDGVDAVIDHAAADVSATEDVSGRADEDAEMDDGSTRDTLPMFDESSEDPAKDAVNDEEIKEASPSTEGESSQSVPAAVETAEGSVNNANLPLTFPHCYCCGFDRETTFMREKKATTGQYKNKLVYRNRCVRKGCYRFFGPSYVWDGKAEQYVKITEEPGFVSRPYANGPREEKYAAFEYERACESGVKPPIDNGGWRKTSKAAVFTGFSTPTKAVVKKIPATIQKMSTSKAPSVPKMMMPPTIKKKTTTAAAAKKPEQLVELARRLATQQTAAMTSVSPVEKPKITRRTFSTQTGDEDHIVETLVQEMRAKATFGTMPPNDEPLSASMSNRLFLTQKALKEMTKELKTVRKERDALKDGMHKVVELLNVYKNELIADTTRLKDDLQVANKELRAFSLEMQNEAHKDIRDINKIKEQVAKRLDDTDRFRRKVEASLEYQQSVTAEAEALADRYHRLSLEKDRDIVIAKMEEKEAKTKLSDKLYITNNAKCAHCHVNERIKNMLTEQIADKTLSATNLGKERAELAKKLENSERIVSIVNKENKQLKFEKSAWEANCHRFRTELQQLKGNAAGLVLSSSTPTSASLGEAAFTPQSTSTKDAEEVSPDRSGDGLMEIDRPPPSASASSAEEGEYKSPSNISPNSLARLPPPPPAPTAAELKESSPELATGFSNWIPKDRKVQEMPPEMAEAMRKVAESLERGPPPKKEDKKKEKRDEKRGDGVAGGKRSGGPHHPSNSHHKNGEKKPKLEGGARKEAKGPPPRPSPTLGPTSKATPVMQKVKEKEKIKEERIRDPSPVPYSSSHEPAFPAVVTKKSVKVPYNGPSSLIAASSTPSSSHSSPRPQQPYIKETPEKKKPMSFLPVAGSSAMPPLPPNPREPPRGVPMNAILVQAEKLRAIEIERSMRGPREAPMQQRPDPPQYPPPRRGDFDDELPWNQGRAPVYQNPARPRTPVQDWYYDAPAGHAPPPQPRAPSPRYYDDMYNPHAPRDQFGRLEPDFGMRHPQPHHLAPAHPHHNAPPLRGAPPPHDAAWRREWPEQNWSNEPPRRGYWD